MLEKCIFRKVFFQSKFGLKSSNVLGDTHCLPKAIVLGKLWSDKNNCKDSGEKNMLTTKFESMIRADVSFLNVYARLMNIFSETRRG